MSTDHFRGSAHAFKRFMFEAQAEIDRGEAKAARVIHAKADGRVQLVKSRERERWWRLVGRKSA